MGRKKKTDPDAIVHVAHDVLILHLFSLFNRIEEQRELGQERRKTNEAAGFGQIDPRTMESAKLGHGIQPKSANKIAKALSEKLHRLIEESGGAEKMLDEMKTSLQWSDPARAFQWLEDRIAGKPPYIHQGDLIINRNDRHLIDEYRISLAVGPTTDGQSVIEYSNKASENFNYKTLAFIKYEMKFSPHNRNQQLDFALCYGTSGRLEVIHPDHNILSEPAVYRRDRNNVILHPDPKSTEFQRLSMLIYGGYEPDREPETENAHFSFMRKALYRRVTFTLDLSSYPEGAFSKKPRLFVVCKLPGREFDCCKMAGAGEGQTVEPNQVNDRRYVWKFESFEQMMIGVHWKTDKDKLPEEITTSREKLIALLPDTV